MCIYYTHNTYLAQAYCLRIQSVILCVLRNLFKHSALNHVIPIFSHQSLASHDPIGITRKLDNPRTDSRSVLYLLLLVSKYSRPVSSVSILTILCKMLYGNPDRMHVSGDFLFSSLAIGYPTPCLMHSRATFSSTYSKR